MCPLMKWISSEKCIIRHFFGHRVNVIEYTYTNLAGIAKDPVLCMIVHAILLFDWKRRGLYMPAPAQTCE